MATEFVKVKNPKKPGEFLILARQDLQGSKYELFDEPVASPPPVVPSPPQQNLAAYDTPVPTRVRRR